MIGSLIYLTASRPDIMFVVYACARFQVTPGACHFLGRRLIFWHRKKQTIVANSTTEAEYVAAANCCGQVLWIQNQMMDYGFNFMNTKIHIDNESTISVIKNPIAHSRTKHIKIRFHFIRDCYEKRLIEVIKIHTAYNVADLLTKGFDVTSVHMANLKYSDKHNMVAFLKKPNESVGFTESNSSGKLSQSEHLLMGLKELMVLVPSVVTMVTSLEKELKDTKQTLGNVVLKLVKKVKSLEKALK
ncbi:hypothetical protein Tco_1528646, partial [Tanacetum coccineum]